MMMESKFKREQKVILAYKFIHGEGASKLVTTNCILF